MKHHRRKILASLGTLLTLPVLGQLGQANTLDHEEDSEVQFLKSVCAGRTEEVRLALSKGPGLAVARDAEGRSAFVLAHIHGHLPIASLLREEGIEFDLIEAVLAEDWTRFEDLCEEHPESINALHPVGGTALYAAALVGCYDFWRLRRAGCQLNFAVEGGTGYTPARGALESPHASWALISLADLCGGGSDVNAPQAGGSSVLHAAVARRDLRLVKLAIRKGANVSAQDEEGRSPLALARSGGWAEGRELLENHASLPRDNRATRFAVNANLEPIHWPDLSAVSPEIQNAVTGNSHSNLAKLRTLVDPNPELVFCVSYDDEIAIEASAHTANLEIMRYHLDKGAPLSLPTAASLGDLGAAEALLDMDPNRIHERGAHDYPLMWYAAMGTDSIDMAQLLFDRGAPIDQETAGTTALHVCVGKGHMDLASWFIENGADLEALAYGGRREGHTPLQLATARHATKMVQFLRDRGAKH